MVLATSLLFDVVGRAATPDSTLVFFTTAALSVFVVGSFRRAAPGEMVGPRRPDGFFPASWWAVAAMYGLMGLAVLAKGPVGFVLPTAVIGMFLLITRLPAAAPAANQGGGWPRRFADRLGALARPLAPPHFVRTCWFMRPLTAILVVLAVAAPWYIAVGLRTDGQWLRSFFVTENVQRALQPMEHHGGSFWYYVVTVAVGLFPWSLFLAPVLIDTVGRIRQRHGWSAGYVFLSCWVCVYLVLFTLARTKLPSYVAPAYPALALLTGCFLHHLTRGAALASPVWLRIAFILLGVVGVGIMTAIPIAAHYYLPGAETLGLAGLVPLAGAIACLVLLRRRMWSGAAAAFAATAACFAIALVGIAAGQVDRRQQSHLLLRAIDQRFPDPQVGAFGCLEPSWVFYGGRPIRELVLDPGRRDVAGGARQPRPPLDAVAFLEANSQRCIITTPRHWDTLRPLAPQGVGVLCEAPYFLRSDKLLLVGWTSGSSHTVSAALTEQNVR